MPPRALAKLGIDYESLRKIRPDVILTASTAFGTAPAVRDRVAFDGVGQCISGAVHLAGTADHPAKAMVPVVDFATGLSCALGTGLRCTNASRAEWVRKWAHHYCRRP
jgi:formyl-CoA transferase